MSNENIMGNRIRQCREDMGLTQEELGLRLGLQRAAINKYEKGAVENMKRASIKKMAEIFGVSPSWLMGIEDEYARVFVDPSFKTVPLLGTIAAGTPIYANENIEDYFRIDCKVKADFALKIKGNSMVNVNILNGDIVFIREQRQLENGEIGAVMIDGEATLKRFYRTDGQVILQAENPEYQPIILSSGDVRVLGKMVASLRQYR